MKWYVFFKYSKIRLRNYCSSIFMDIFITYMWLSNKMETITYFDMISFSKSFLKIEMKNVQH